MNNNQIYDYLESVFPLSSGLKAYLEVALKGFQFEKNELIPRIFFQENPLVFLMQGTMKTHINGLKEPGQNIVRFHFEQSIVVNAGQLNEHDYSVTITAVEACMLKTLPIKHEYNLFKLFPEYHQLVGKLHQNATADLLTYIFHLRFEEGYQRLRRLMEIQPRLFQIASIHDISAAVGVHPHTLSAYRK
jgi:hypothetical protein